MSTTPKARPPGALTLRLIDLTATTIYRVAPWLVVAWLLLLLHNLVLAASATSDAASAWIELLGSAPRTRVFAFVFGILGTLYGLRQRALRHDAVARLKERVRKLDRRIADFPKPPDREPPPEALP